MQDLDWISIINGVPLRIAANTIHDTDTYPDWFGSLEE
ncbi:unnamed protein product, partial [marine sediment metagenome]